MSLWRIAFVCAALLTGGDAFAQNWGNYAFVSSTLGVNADRLCLGDGTRGDIGCPTYAPSVSSGGLLTATGISITTNQASFTTVYASGRVGVGTADPSSALHVSGTLRIGGEGKQFSLVSSNNDLYLGSTSANTSLRLGQNTSGNVNFDTQFFYINGNNVPYFSYIGAGTTRMRLYGNTGQLALNISSTLPSATLHVGGNALITSWTGINFSSAGNVTPTAPLEVSGTVSATRFVGDGSGLTGVIAAGSDRITSGTTQVIANNGGNIDFKTGSTITGYYTPGGIMSAVGISTSSNQASFTTVYASGNVGIGTTAPVVALDVSGSVRVGNSAVACTDSLLGAIRHSGVNGELSVCSHDGSVLDWINLAKFAKGTTDQTPIYPMGWQNGGADQYMYIGKRAAGRSLTLYGGATNELKLDDLNVYVSSSGFAVGRSVKASTTLHVLGTALTTSWTGINFSSAANVTPTAPLEVSGTVSATRFVGDGSGLTGVIAAGSDRIVSGTTSVIANNGGNIDFKTGSTLTGYYTPGGVLYSVGISSGLVTATGINVTGNQSSFTTIWSSAGVNVSNSNVRIDNGSLQIINGPVLQRFGTIDSILRPFASGGAIHVGTSSVSPTLTVSGSLVGIGTIDPSETLHVSGTFRVTNNVLNQSAAVFRNNAHATDLSISFVNSDVLLFSGGGDNLAIGAGGRRGDIYISATAPYVGISTTAPSTTLHVNGTLRIANGAEACDTDRAGAVRWNSGSSQFQVCYGSGGWALLSSAAVSGTDAPESQGITDLSDAYASTTTGSLFVGATLGTTQTSIITNTTAVGVNALASARGGGHANTAFGGSALTNTTTGSFNTALGFAAMASNLTGSSNMAVGQAALFTNTAGDFNTAIGRSALNLHNGNYATAIGYAAGLGASGMAVTNTVLIGANAGRSMTSAERNTVVGTSAGYYVTTGDDNILIGYQVSTPLVTSSNRLNIGDSIYGDMASAASAVGGAAKIGINFVTPTEALEVSGTVSATRYVGDGSGLTGVIAAGSDRIVSGTTSVIANNGGNIDFKTGSTITGYYTPGGIMSAVGISTSSNQASFTTVYASGKLNVGDTAYPWLSVTNASTAISNTFGLLHINNGSNNRGFTINAASGYFDSSNTTLSLNKLVNENVTLAAGGGKVGVGTADPSSSLHVMANSNNALWADAVPSPTVNTGYTVLRLGKTYNMQSELFRVNVSDTGGASVMGFHGIRWAAETRFTRGDATGDKLMAKFFGNNTVGHQMLIYSSDSTAVRVLLSSEGDNYFTTPSNTGIGTSTPNSKLHIVGVSTSSGGLTIGTATEQRLQIFPLFNGSAGIRVAVPTGVLSIMDANSASVALFDMPTRRFMLLGSNTGLQTPSATLHVNGNALITSWTGINFSSAGNVTPTAPLEVSGTVSATRFVGDGSGLTGVIAAGSDRITSGTTQVIANNGGNIDFMTGSTITGYYTPGGIMNAVGISTSSNQASFTTVYASGNVGIGTTDPSDSLHVYGRSVFGTAAPFKPSVFGSTPTVQISSNAGGVNGMAMRSMATGVGDEFRFSVEDTVGSYLAFSMPSVNNTGTMFGITRSSGNFLFSNSAGSSRVLGIGTVGSNSLIFGTDNAERMRIVSSGLVGIGTVAPSATLHVYEAAGNAAFRVTQGAGSRNLTFDSGGFNINTQAALGPVSANTGYAVMTSGNGAAPARHVLTARGASGQTGNLLRVENSSGVGLSGFDAAGQLGVNTVTPTTAVEVSGTVSATRFVGDGSGLTGVIAAGSDRITSGTTQVIANNGGNIDFMTGSTITGYYTPGGIMSAVGISTSSNQASFTTVYASGKVGIGTDNPSSNLTVANTFNVSRSDSVIMASFDRNGASAAAGSTRFAISSGNSWIGAASGFDFFVSNTAAVGVNMNGVRAITISSSGLVGMGGLAAPTTSLEVSGTVSATRFVGNGSGLTNLNAAAMTAAGNPGELQVKANSGAFGTSTTLVWETGPYNEPNLKVSGTIQLTTSLDTESCAIAKYGMMRVNPVTKALQICRE